MNSKPSIETIHGYPIIAQATLRQPPGHRPGRLVLLQREGRGPDRNGVDYVVSRQYFDTVKGEWDSEWNQGHYIESRDLALETFAERLVEALR